MSRIAFVAAASAALLLGSACIRSRVVITSEPSGAVVTMNGDNLGTTPVTAPFTWYWYYDFVALKEGYENGAQRKRFRPPFYLYPPLDFFAELLPFRIRDTKQVHFDLKPEETRPDPMLSERAPLPPTATPAPTKEGTTEPTQ